ncbi:MAG: extracellular solute-binding protein [Lachnospiraceae bacterium]|nr:extracellular solute-binding protein [Lachnospiraceae bacterium]
MKKNLFKRMMALLLALVMVLSLAACGTPVDQTEAPADKTEAPADKTEAPTDKTEAPTEAATFDPREICEGVTITIAVPEDVEVPDWENNLTTLAIEEALGVNLEFQVFAAADYLDKLNVMVNGGDELPDIIFRGDGNSLDSSYQNWAAEEVLVPLNKYYEDENYSANFRASCEVIGRDLLPSMIDAEGKLWYVPRYWDAPTNETPSKLWYNGEWSEKLGFDEIVTTEDFYELCKAFVAAGDLNGNGKDDEVCLTDYAGHFTWFNNMMNAFVYATDDYWLDAEDGELRFAFTTEEWKEGLKYIRRFFTDGLLDTTILTQDKAAHQAIINGSIPTTLAFWDYYPGLKVPEDNLLQRQYNFMYDYVPNLKGPKGTVEVRYEPILPSVGAVITTDCENPDAAFLVLDYMCNEELGITSRYGERGVNWDYWDEAQQELYSYDLSSCVAPAEGYELYTVAYSDGTYWGKGNPQMAGYMQAGPAVIGRHVYYGMAFPTVSADLLKDPSERNKEINELRVNQNLNKNYKSIVDCHAEDVLPAETVLTLPMTSEESQDVNEIWMQLEGYVEESIGAFLTGEWDIDGYWDTYMAELEKIGYEDALAIYQTAYDRTK